MAEEPTPAALLSVLCRRQQQGWQRGERPRAESYLEQHPALADGPTGAVGLISQGLLPRGQPGAAPRPDEFIRRFPQFAPQLRPVFRVDRPIGGEWPKGDASSTDAGTTTNRERPLGAGYEVLGELGRGGMGVARRARQRLRESEPHGAGEPDLRGFGWHYLRRVCRLELHRFEGHTGPVAGVALSPDGRRLASASRDGTVRVWDATELTPQGLIEYETHSLVQWLFKESRLPTLPVVSASTVGLMASHHGQGPFLAASALLPGRTPLPEAVALAWVEPCWRIQMRQAARHPTSSARPK